jgi:hypothetical protein
MCERDSTYATGMKMKSFLNLTKTRIITTKTKEQTVSWLYVAGTTQGWILDAAETR